MISEECIEIITLVCTLVTTITAVVSALFVVIQIRNGTRAQQDKKAPLLILNREGESISKIYVNNAGELPANNVKVTLCVLNQNSPWETKKLSKPITIDKDAKINVFNISEELETNTDTIVKVKVAIKYNSPLNDRVRTSKAEFVR